MRLLVRRCMHTVLLAGMVLLLSTCNDSVIGLGSAIDITPPTMTIGGPSQTIKALRGEFLLHGTISDDRGIKSIAVTVQKSRGSAHEKAITFDVPSENIKRISSQTYEWSIMLNKEENGRYPLSDGKYEVSALGADFAGKTVTTETVFTVDNTPPLFVVTRPSTVGFVKGDLFGDELRLEGETADEAGVKKIRITAYNKETGKKMEIFERAENIPSNVRLTLDSFKNSKDSSSFYRALYGDEDNAGDKEFYCAIEMWDGAVTYREKNKINHEGNSADTYYLYEPLVNGIVFPVHTIDDLYKMIAGTYDPSISRAASGKTMTQKDIDVIVTGLKEGRFEGVSGQNETFKIKLPAGDTLSNTDKEKAGTFTLNPLANPRFEIVGYEPINIKKDKPKDLIIGSSITVKLSPNNDNVPLNKDFKVYAIEKDVFTELSKDKEFTVNNPQKIYKKNTDGTLTENLLDGVIGLPLPAVNVQGSSRLISLHIADGLLAVGKGYVIQVAGADKLKNTFMPVSKNSDGTEVDYAQYCIIVRGVGKPPQMKVTKIGPVDNGEKNITAVVYVKKGETVSSTVHIVSETYPVTVTYVLSKEAEEKMSETKTLNASGIIQFDIPKESFLQNQNASYSLNVKAESDTIGQTEQNYQIYYDVEPPIFSGGVSDGSSYTEMPVIKGSLLDIGAGVDLDSLKAVYTYNSGAEINWNFKTRGESWELEPLADAQEGSYKLTLSAADKLGQKTAVTSAFTYDAAEPEIRDIKIDGSFIAENMTAYTKNGTITLSGNLIEKNGIQTFTIADSDYTPLTAGIFSKELTFDEEGEHSIKIKVIDNAGKEKNRVLTVVSDKTAPHFKSFNIGNMSYTDAVTLDSTPIGIEGIFTDIVTETVKPSGIQKLQYRIADGEWKDLVGAQTHAGYKISGSLPIEMNDSKQVIFKAIDNAGNEKEWQSRITVSSAQVSLKLTADGAVTAMPDTVYAIYRKEPFNINIAAASDGDIPSGGDVVNVKIVKSNGDDVVLSSFFTDETVVRNIKVTKTLAPTSCKVNTSSLDDGEYTIEIAAGGKKQSLTVHIDKKPPVLDTRVPAQNQQFKEETNLYGSIFDGSGAGVHTIKAKLNGTDHALKLTGSSWESDENPAFKEGLNKIVFTFADRLGNIATKEVPFFYDSKNPILKNIVINNQSSEKVWIKGDNTGITPFKIEGKAQDPAATVSAAGNLDAVRFDIVQQDNAAWLGLGHQIKDASVTGAGEKTWVWDQIGSSTYPLNGAGKYSVSITAIDKSGRTTVETRSIEVDTQPPSVDFTAPAAGVTVNKIITVSGTASDIQKLKSVTIVKQDGSLLTGASNHAGDPLTEVKFTGDEALNWSFKLNTADYVPESGFLVLKAVALDEVGNKTEKTHTITVDQHSDRPQIVITNITALSGTDNYITSNVLNLVVLDDDGDIKQGNFKINNTDVQKKVGGWQYNLGSDGEKTLKFTITDGEDTVFTTEEAAKAQPRIYAREIPTGGTDNGYGTSISFKVDTLPPQTENPIIQFSHASDYSNLKDLAQNTKLNIGTIYVQIKASDANGIKSITGKIEDEPLFTAASEGTPSGGVETWRASFEFTKIHEGVKLLTVEITDNADSKTQFTRTLIIDNTAPTIKQTYPTPTDPQSGKITVQGSIEDGTDSAGVKADGTKWKIVKKDAAKPTPADSDWKEMKTPSVATWSFDFNFATEFAADSHTDYGTANEVTPTYFDIPVYILTEDTVGNKAVREIKLLYNPDGAKPIMEILSPSANATVGGTTQIFGVGRVSVGIPDDIGKVYIQFSKNPEFNEVNCTINHENWWNGGEGISVLDATAVDKDILGSGTGASWRMEVNKKNKLNPEESSSKRWDLWFRVRGKNTHSDHGTAGKLGEWSLPIKITIDPSAPTIGSKQPLKLNLDTVSPPPPPPVVILPATPLDYVQNMWIKGGYMLTGSLHDESGIASLTISGDLENGAVYDLSQAKAKGWIVEDTVNQPSTAEYKNYLMKIPLNLSKLTADAKSKKEFKLKIEVAEGTTDKLKADKEFVFRYDIDPPVGDFGEKKGIAHKEFAGTSVIDSVIAGFVGMSHTGKKLLVDNTLVSVTGVTGTEVSFNPSVTHGSHNVIVYEPKAVITDAMWTARGVANDDGSGVKEVKAWVEVGTAKTTPVLCALGDPNNKITRELGSQCSWEAKIDLSAIPDGKGKVYYEIFDNSGNSSGKKSFDVFVRRKALTVSKVILATEVSGNTLKAEDIQADNPTKDAAKNFTGVFSKNEFAFKSLTASFIELELLGNGEGEKSYSVYSDASFNPDGTIANKGTVLTDHNGKSWPTNNTIQLTETDLNAIGNSTGDDLKVLVIEIRDSYHGITATDPAAVTVIVKTRFKALDDQKPSVVILPFHWNSENANSLYQNNRENGHVEIKPVSGLTAHSSVSGKVSIRGFAYDNVQLNKLTAALPDTTPLTITRSGSTWSLGSNPDKGIIAFTVEKSDYDYLGYYLCWRIDWDTEKATVGTGKDIKVTANDGVQDSDVAEAHSPTGVTAIRSTVSTAEHSSFADVKPGQFLVVKKDECCYLTRVKRVTGNTLTLEKDIPEEATMIELYPYTANKPAVKVNIVPYITEIGTPKRTDSGLTKNTIRSSDGKFSIIKGDTGGFITVKGFNLSNPVVRIVKESDLQSATVASGVGLTVTGSGSEFTLKNDLSKSGYLEVFVGGVRATNNINNNDNIYNKEADLYVLKNKTLNDDRYLRVFDMKKTAVRNGYYPEMIMDGNDPVFGYINLSGAPQNVTGGYYDNHAMPQRAKFDGNNGNTTATEYLIKASIWEQMGMARDEGGRYYHATTYNRSGAAMSFIYDKYAALHSGSADSYSYQRGMGWGSGTGYSGYGGNYSHNANNNALTLESVNYGSLLLDRYQYPKIIAKGNSKTDKAVVYMAYYDANTTDKELIFRNFQIGKKDKVAGSDMGAPTKFKLYANSSSGYEQWTNLAENSSNTDTYSTGRLTLATNATQYFDMGVLSGGRVVVVYFDETVGKLKLRYSNDPVTGATPEAVVAWIDSSASFPDYVGQYVSMDIDSNGGIHIAAFDSSNGDLMYFYLDSYNSTTLKTALVDAAFSVGQWTQVKVHNNKPYIAYYNSSEAGQRSAIKLAVAKDNVGTVKNGVGTSKTDEANTIESSKYYEDGFVTSRWECMTVPSISPAQGGTPKFKKVNLGFDTAGRPVLGYLGGNIEFGTWLDE